MLRPGVAALWPWRAIEVGDMVDSAKGRLTGTVRCATKAPLSGARVCVSDTASEWLDAERPTCTDAGADGNFALPGLRPGVYSVEAAADGCTTDAANRQLAEVAPGAPAQALDVTLTPGGTFIEGIVVDVHDQPVKWAVVRWMRVTRPRLPMSADTGADGRFRIPASEGETFLQVEANGYALAEQARRAPATGVVIHLAPESTISGHVLSAYERRPLAHAVVHAVRSGGWASDRDPLGVSDESGAFRIAGLRAASYDLVAIGSGWRGATPSKFTVGTGEHVNDVRVEVETAREVEGTVVWADGTPCEEGLVLLDPVSPGPPHLGEPPAVLAAVRSSVPTMASPIGAGGRVSFSAVPPGVYHVGVQTPSAVLSEGPRLLEVGAANVSGLVWKTARGGGIVMHVVDALGRPVPYAHTRLLGLRAPGSEGRVIVPITVDRTGTYDLSGTLFAGTYRIEPGNGFSGEPLDVDVPPASTVEVTFRLRGAAAIAVVVRDTNGTPVVDIAVRATSGTRSVAAESLGGGEYRMAPLEAGDYEVEVFDGVNVPVWASGPSGTAIAVPAEGTASVQVLVDRGATLKGRVVDAQGAPVKARVRARCASAEVEKDLPRMAALLSSNVKRDPIETGLDGSFTIGGVARNASCTLRAEALTGGAGSTPDVHPGEQALIALRPGGSGN
jgi:hypothetical protein